MQFFDQSGIVDGLNVLDCLLKNLTHGEGIGRIFGYITQRTTEHLQILGYKFGILIISAFREPGDGREDSFGSWAKRFPKWLRQRRPTRKKGEARLVTSRLVGQNLPDRVG